MEIDVDRLKEHAGNLNELHDQCMKTLIKLKGEISSRDGLDSLYTVVSKLLISGAYIDDMIKKFNGKNK